MRQNPPIRVGLHDEIFQGSQPVLAGADARSTYCYLLAAAEHRDADTWGIHLLDAARQGLNPDYTITRLPMRARACAPDRRRPGETSRATATYSTSSISARPWPTPWPASPRGPGRDVKSCKPRPGKHARIQTLPTGSRSPCGPKLERTLWPATSERSPPGSPTTSWRWPARA